MKQLVIFLLLSISTCFAQADLTEAEKAIVEEAKKYAQEAPPRAASSRLRARMQSEFGIEESDHARCRYELVGKSVLPKSSNDSEKMSLEECENLAVEALKKNHKSFAKVMVKHGTGEWKVIEWKNVKK